MIHFFGNVDSKGFALQTSDELSAETISNLTCLFGNAPKINTASLDAFFVGPRAAMVTPWSTNAVEITQNMGIEGIIRIEEFKSVDSDFSDYYQESNKQYIGYLLEPMLDIYQDP